MTPSDLTLTSAAALPRLGGGRIIAPDSIRKQAENFEAVFLNTMMQSMFTGLEEGGAWGGGQGSDTWQKMLIDEMSKTIASAGGIGLANTIERELLALQEANQ
ncbi:rod-binding protein [Pannonibacter sp. Q-1]|uniref:Chemotaxis protein n=2 Tax=Pannonibacter TaxID=227873 RepID=A0A0U3P5X2_9HYPH|nr:MULTISPECIES: rod-binding protein [Pannonibacter]ALV28210.1 chemotaxis protein [Pannonibacter phragmitetus]MBA4206744.1 peptidoglycan hydrolase FlgJ [Polymorphum sp.]CUA91768.1 Rod binding protein [Pannonibacter indicus]